MYRKVTHKQHNSFTCSLIHYSLTYLNQTGPQITETDKTNKLESIQSVKKQKQIIKSIITYNT